MKCRMFVTTVALALCAAVGALAADKPGKGEGRPHHGPGLLPPPIVEKLTADQKAKYDAILADYQKAMQDAAGDKEKMKTARKDAHEKAIALLTDDQKAELKKLGPPPGKRGEGPRKPKEQ